MSKGLEALKEIEKFIEKNLSKTKDNESFNLGFDIGIIEKELKALEIIKTKKVNVGWLFVSFKNYAEYKDALDNEWTIVKQISLEPLTQEEYDLLKEVLC